MCLGIQHLYMDYFLIFLTLLPLFVSLSLSFFLFCFFLLSLSLSRLFLFSHFLWSFVSFVLSFLIYFHCTVALLFPFIIYRSLFFLLLFYFPIYGSQKNVMENHHYRRRYRMIHHRQIPISMQDNPKHIVIKYLLFTEVWKSKNIWFLLCTQNGAEGLREKAGLVLWLALTF